MDIIRGSLDDISRPASSSRIHHGSKVLSSSLEILTPEPDLPLVDYSLDLYNNQIEDNSEEKIDENREDCGIKRMRTSEEILEGKTDSNFQQLIQNKNDMENASSSVDSEDDCAENNYSNSSSASQDKLVKLQAVSSTKLEDTKERDTDHVIQKAIKKMKRLDQILASKQSQERAIKKQGREMRTKLWEELQSVAPRSSSVTTEEVENTSRFLALTSSLEDTPEPATIYEDEMFISVFDTQIHPENYECSRKQSKQDCLNEDKTTGLIKKMENMPPQTETNCKKPHNFIKKNIELVKDSGNQVVMLEEEKRRLSELLKDSEDESRECQVVEEEATEWLVPGEGYTPEPMEYHHLAEINAKLEVVISDGNLSAVQNSCSKVPKQIYQESLAYANRKLETVPGEKVLRDTKEERDQQNRLKEIDQQLKNLEETPDVLLPCLSEEQLSALLEECMQSQRTVTSPTLPEFQGSFPDVMRPCCNTFEDSIRDSRNELLDEAHNLGMLTSHRMTGGDEVKDVCSKGMIENSGSNLSQALVESHLTEDAMIEGGESDNQEGQQDANVSNSEGNFMSIALSTERMKNLSFPDEPFYCISTNDELPTDVDIPVMPLKTVEDKMKDEEMLEKLCATNLTTIKSA